MAELYVDFEEIDQLYGRKTAEDLRRVLGFLTDPSKYEMHEKEIRAIAALANTMSRETWEEAVSRRLASHADLADAIRRLNGFDGLEMEAAAESMCQYIGYEAAIVLTGIAPAKRLYVADDDRLKRLLRSYGDSYKLFKIVDSSIASMGGVGTQMHEHDRQQRLANMADDAYQYLANYLFQRWKAGYNVWSAAALLRAWKEGNLTP